MRLASLKGPGRDGSLVVVDRRLQRAAPAAGVVSTLQEALEHWDHVRPGLEALSRALQDGGNAAATFDFAAALEAGRVAAPLPRAYAWLDGSAYLSHVERGRGGPAGR